MPNPIMTKEAREIAGTLTKAQRRAIAAATVNPHNGLFQTGGPVGPHLIAKGLAEPKFGGLFLTDFGEQVRAILQEQSK